MLLAQQEVSHSAVTMMDQLGPGAIPVAILTVLGTVGIVITLGIVGFCQWRAYRERDLATRLIHDLAAQGFTSEEIVKILETSGVGHREPIDVNDIQFSFGPWQAKRTKRTQSA